MIEHQRIELGGATYCVLPLAAFEALCRRAGGGAAEDELALLRRERLADRLKQRRVGAGLTQAELARRAGVRPETVNRIERGRVDPDFATVRKLVEAIAATEESRHARVDA